MKVVIFGNDSGAFDSLARLRARAPDVAFARGTGPDVTRSHGLHALLLTLMQAERFGAAPPFPFERSFVFETPAADVEEGLPRYIVAGLETLLSEPRDWPRELRLLLSKSFQAIREFNKNGDKTIDHVGILADNLMVDRLGPEAALQILNETIVETS